MTEPQKQTTSKWTLPEIMAFIAQAVININTPCTAGVPIEPGSPIALALEELCDRITERRIRLVEL